MIYSLSNEMHPRGSVNAVGFSHSQNQSQTMPMPGVSLALWSLVQSHDPSVFMRAYPWLEYHLKYNQSEGSHFLL